MSGLTALPCPFCGSNDICVEKSGPCLVDAQQYLLGDTRVPQWNPTAIVSCVACGAIGPVTNQQSVAEAIQRWNARPSAVRQLPPLSAHALAELKDLANSPCPRQAVNPGVANRLLRESLVESVMLPSPFRTHAGKPLEHLRITDAGRTLFSTFERNPP